MSGIQDSLVELFKAGQAQSPACTAYIGQIMTLTNQMQTQITTQVSLLQATLDGAWNDLKSCDTRLIVKNTTNPPFSPEVTTYMQCTQQNDVLEDTITQCSNTSEIYEEAKNNSQQVFNQSEYAWPVDCTPDPSSAPANQSALGLITYWIWFFQQQLISWENVYDEYVYTYQQWSNFTLRCQNITSYYNTQVDVCNNVTTTIYRTICGDTPQNQLSCDCYQDCYNKNYASWQTTQTAVTAQLSSLLGEWNQILRIQCILNSILQFQANPATDCTTLINTCLTSIILTAPSAQVSLVTYPTATNALPPPLVCNGTLPLYGPQPGTTAYVNMVCNGLPSTSPCWQQVCDASCCANQTGMAGGCGGTQFGCCADGLSYAATYSDPCKVAVIDSTNGYQAATPDIQALVDATKVDVQAALPSIAMTDFTAVVYTSQVSIDTQGVEQSQTVFEVTAGGKYAVKVSIGVNIFANVCLYQTAEGVVSFGGASRLEPSAKPAFCSR